MAGCGLPTGYTIRPEDIWTQERRGSVPAFKHGGSTTTADVLDGVVGIHAQETASLHNTRSALASAPQVDLYRLRRLDDRLAAHLDGLAVAGQQAWSFCEAALETPSQGGVFAAAVRAIDEKQEERLERLFVLAEAVLEARRGLISAFGWLERSQLRGVVAGLLKSTDSLKRTTGHRCLRDAPGRPGDRPAELASGPQPAGPGRRAESGGRDWAPGPADYLRRRNHGRGPGLPVFGPRGPPFSSATANTHSRRSPLPVRHLAPTAAGRSDSRFRR